MKDFPNITGAFMVLSVLLAMYGGIVTASFGVFVKLVIIAFLFDTVAIIGFIPVLGIFLLWPIMTWTYPFVVAYAALPLGVVWIASFYFWISVFIGLLRYITSTLRMISAMV